MFTICPNCETVFELERADLDRARGQVRCGECETVFDATRTLSHSADLSDPVTADEIFGSEDDPAFAETGIGWVVLPAEDEQALPDDEQARYVSANEQEAWDSVGTPPTTEASNLDTAESLAAPETQDDDFAPDEDFTETQVHDPEPVSFAVFDGSIRPAPEDDNDDEESDAAEDVDDDADDEESDAAEDFGDDADDEESDAAEDADDDAGDEESDAADDVDDDADEEESDAAENIGDDAGDEESDAAENIGDDAGDDAGDEESPEVDDVEDDTAYEDYEEYPEDGDNDVVDEEDWAALLEEIENLGEEPRSAGSVEPDDDADLADGIVEESGAAATEADEEPDDSGSLVAEAQLPDPDELAAAFEDSEEIILESAPLPEERSSGGEPDVAASDVAEAQPDDLFATGVGEARSRGGSRRPGQRVWTILALAAAALGLVQYLHQNRSELATVPSLNPLFETVYGDALDPHWDVRNICYERRASYAADNIMVIYARLANRGDTPLPYPLFHVTLSGRYDNGAGHQAVSHRILAPEEYLDHADIAGRVAAGVTFEAFARLVDPGPEVTGYNVEACYRRADGYLYCNGGCPRS